MRWEINGSSDDNIGVGVSEGAEVLLEDGSIYNGDVGAEEFYALADGNRHRPYVARLVFGVRKDLADLPEDNLHVRIGGEILEPVAQVFCLYDGCWAFAFGLWEEDMGIPEGWTVEVEQAHPYSTSLIVTAPVQAELMLAMEPRP